MNSLIFKFCCFFCFLCLLGFATQVFAEQKEPNDQADFFEMSIEELMEVPIVVSASRQEQKITESSVPISIITAEDIHYSGLTNIPDILRFSCGVDVLRFDRNRYGVGVRGLHGLYSDRTLVLVNGRSANDPVYGRTNWLDIPILIEDIDHIEIVRGPTGSAWGANAFTGMINIITKKPEDVLGYFGSTTINEFGDTYTHIRWGEKQGKWSWRLSAGYEDFEDSDAAGAGKYDSAMTALNGLMGFDTFTANDFRRNWKFDSEVIHQYSDNTRLSFGAGYSYNETGSCEYIGQYVSDHQLISSTRLFSRIDHSFDDESSVYLQWFGNIYIAHNPPLEKRYSFSEHDIEGQYNFKIGDKHNLSVGGNVRWNRIKTINTYASTWPGEPINEQWAGAFLLDRFKLNDRLTLEGQVRTDWFSETHEDWSLRTMALYGLDKAKKHVLRIGFAKAFRAPAAVTQENIARAVGGILVVGRPAEELRNEETWSLEAGYTGKLADNVTLRIDGYYQRFEYLIHLNSLYTEWDNIDGGTSAGAEVELAVEDKWGKLSAWYAYNNFHTDQYGQGIRSYYPAYNKVGLTGRLYMPGGLTLNTNYAYNNGAILPMSGLQNTDVYHRIDVTISKRFSNDRGEIMVGVSDLFNGSHDTIFPNGQFTNHETPGRTFFARVQLKF